MGNGATGPAQVFVAGSRDVALATRIPLGLVSDPQLRVEHALDLTHSDIAIFVTEAEQQALPVTFERIAVSPPHAIASAESAVHPADVVHTLATLGRRDTLPACYALSLRADTAEDTRAEIAAAGLRLLRELLDDPDPMRWDEKASAP